MAWDVTLLKFSVLYAIPVLVLQCVHISYRKAAFASLYTDSCCTEGHVKRDNAYCGCICSFVCNLKTFLTNSMSR
jgi:hypothetical protein